MQKKTLVKSLKGNLVTGEEFYSIPEEKTKFLLRGSCAAVTRLLDYSDSRDSKLSTACRSAAADIYDMVDQLCTETGASPLDKAGVDSLKQVISSTQGKPVLKSAVHQFTENPSFAKANI